MKFEELNHVALHVADVARSCEFYERVLRLAALPRPAFTFPGAWFQLGAHQELHLIGNRSEPVHSHHRGNHFALLTGEIEAWERHFAGLGIAHAPRKKRPDGAWQVFLTDPDGHTIEVCSRPGMAPMGN